MIGPTGAVRPRRAGGWQKLTAPSFIKASYLAHEVTITAANANMIREFTINATARRGRAGAFAEAMSMVTPVSTWISQRADAA